MGQPPGERTSDERPDGHPVAAVAVLAVTWGCVAATVVVQLTLGVLPVHDAPFPANPGVFLISIAAAVVTGAASAIVLVASRHPVGAVSAVLGIGFGLSALGTVVKLAGYRPEDAGDPWAPYSQVGQFLELLSVPATFIALTVLPWYLPAPRPRGALRVGLLAGLACTAIIIFDVAVGQQDGLPDNPLSLRGTPVAGVLEVLLPLTLFAALGVAVAAMLTLFVQWRHEPRGSRSRRAYGAMAVAFALMVAAFVVLQYGSDDGVLGVAGTVALLTMFAGVLLFPLSISVAVLGSWERPLQLFFPRAVVWSLLSAIVVAVYILLVSLVSLVFPVDDVYVRLVAVAVVALAVQPVRSWLQRRVDRLVYGTGSDPVSFLARVGEELRGVHAAGGALPGLVDSLRRGLRLAAVEVRSHQEPYVGAQAGDVDSAAQRQVLSLPLVLDGRDLGELRLHAAPGQRLDQRAVRVAGHVTELVAVSLDLAQTNQRLREASQRLGEVRHEERRMLRRELHDGMGPALAGVGLGLAAARRRLLRDPEGTADLLTELEAELARRTDDVRLLARSLLPAQLDDGDLPQALEVMAERFRESGLQVLVGADGLGEIDTRHQIALYHVATEALLNAHRHARAETVTVCIRRDEQGLRLEVTDDGVGIPAEPRRGVGLQSMHERADELGGRLEIGSRPQGRGTRVRMVL